MKKFIYFVLCMGLLGSCSTNSTFDAQNTILAMGPCTITFKQSGNYIISDQIKKFNTTITVVAGSTKELANGQTLVFDSFTDKTTGDLNKPLVDIKK